MRQYQLFELVYPASVPEEMSAVDLEAVFTINNESVRVKGFHDGVEGYRIRYYPVESGLCHWTVSGVVQDEGEEYCEPGHGGIVRADGCHFRRDDGSWFYPLGTTVYALLHQPQALFDQTMQSLEAAPFNKVRLCVFPKYYDYNRDEPEQHPFAKTSEGKPDVKRPEPEFWRKMDLCLAKLNELGIQADLILFHPYDKWGYAEMNFAECCAYLDYIVRRLSAFPNVWWSLSNEYELLDHFEMSWWNEFAMLLRERDPFHHLISNHNWITPWDFSDENMSHCCIQGGFVEETAAYIQKYNKPVVFDELGYEGDLEQSWGNLSAREIVRRFWLVYTSGGYATHGETFQNKEEILWWSKGGVLRGQSVARLQFLRDVLESLPGPLSAGATDMPDLEMIRKHPEQAPQNEFIKRVQSMSEHSFVLLQRALHQDIAHAGDQCILFYYDLHCPKEIRLRLPPKAKYQIEILDTWEMIRTVLPDLCSGQTVVPLPGKEAMAILARRVECTETDLAAADKTIAS